MPDPRVIELIEAALNEVQLRAIDPDSERYRKARERYEQAVRDATPLVAQFDLPDNRS
jgi:hypothetical protein